MYLKPRLQAPGLSNIRLPILALVFPSRTQAIGEITAWLGSAFRGQETPLKNQCELQGRMCTVLNWVTLVWRLLVHGEQWEMVFPNI